MLASISGFGRSGPWGDYVALHSGVILLSGLASVTRDSAGDMRLAGAIYPDLLAGTYMALAIEQALARARAHGRGCHVEVSMLDVLLACMGGLVPERRRWRADRPISVPLPPAPRAGPVRGHVRRRGRGARRRRRRRRAGRRWSRLQAAGVARGAPCSTLAEVIEDPHLAARGFVREDDHPVAGPRPIPAVPWRYDGARPELRHCAVPRRRTDAVLAGLAGRTIEELDLLREQGVLV